MDKETKKPFTFDDPKKHKIHERLELVGPGPASFYRDACYLMKGNCDLKSKSHIIGHLFREIESAIRDVLLTYEEKERIRANKLESRRKLEINEALKKLEIPINDPVALAWLSLPQKIELQKLAHRKNLEYPRELSYEIQLQFEEVEKMFDLILEKFESNYFNLSLFRINQSFLYHVKI